jgi:hypothetical protein
MSTQAEIHERPVVAIAFLSDLNARVPDLHQKRIGGGDPVAASALRYPVLRLQSAIHFEMVRGAKTD